MLTTVWSGPSHLRPASIAVEPGLHWSPVSGAKKQEPQRQWRRALRVRPDSGWGRCDRHVMLSLSPEQPRRNRGDGFAPTSSLCSRMERLGEEGTPPPVARSEGSPTYPSNDSTWRGSRCRSATQVGRAERPSIRRVRARTASVSASSSRSFRRSIFSCSSSISSSALTLIS